MTARAGAIFAAKPLAIGAAAGAAAGAGASSAQAGVTIIRASATPLRILAARGGLRFVFVFICFSPGQPSLKHKPDSGRQPILAGGVIAQPVEVAATTVDL